MAFSLFDGGNAYAKTDVLHTTATTPDPLNKINDGVFNLGYKSNGRDALLQTCAGKASLWEWSGTAWVASKVWTLPIGFKSNKTIARMRISRNLKQDIVLADSVTRTIMVLVL